MKISYNWLQDYIPTEIELKNLSEILTNTGLEVASVDKVEKIPGGLEGLVVGEILDVQKHSNADRLTVCKVLTDIGEERSIVCGAPNVEKGQKVVVALPGTTIYPIEGEAFQIKKGKIRGEASEGMICAEDEIGLGKNHDGIIVLDKKAKVGMDVKKHYKIKDDYSIEIDLTPNRTDAISHFGVARDYLAVRNLEKDTSDNLIIPDLSSFAKDNDDLLIDVVVEDKEACPRYSGLSMTNLKIADSPEWLKERLAAIGINSINNVVDIANYVMYETGQPLHVFDASEISGNKVIIKKLDSGTVFTTLDEEERKLDRNDLMICNSTQGMCIAGVFGGISSGVKNSTEKIFIESAYFSASGIRKTAKRHGLSTDASYRYERGANPEATRYALKRVALLIKEVTGAKISSDIIDVYPSKIKNVEVQFRLDFLRRMAGKEIKTSKVLNILSSLGFEVLAHNGDEMSLRVPLYRAEVTREIDVVEEILRIYGYNNIEIPERMQTSITPRPAQDEGAIRNLIGSVLSAQGFNEVMNNSLTSEKYVVNEDAAVKIKNPLSNELSVMRMSLDPGGLESIRFNINRKSEDLKFYEFGKTYELLEDGFKESVRIGLWATGLKDESSWDEGEKAFDFYNLKRALESILLKMSVSLDKAKIIPTTAVNADFGLDYMIGKRKLASVWKFNDDLLQKMEIDKDVYGADIDWQILLQVSADSKVHFTALPKFPSTRRDLALLIDESVEYGSIERIAKDVDRKILRNVNLFDVYKGKGIDPSKKSYAVSFTFRDDNKTLTDSHVDKVMSKLIDRLKKELGAELR